MSVKRGNDIVLLDSDNEEEGETTKFAKKARLEDDGENTGESLEPYVNGSSSEEDSEVGSVINEGEHEEVGPNEENGESSQVEDSLLSSESETTSSDDGLLQISLNSSGISPQTVIETRKYLKEFGTMKFLEKYLPATASSDDLIRIIIQLGFFPRNIPTESDNLLHLITFLHQAMKNVRSIRSRLNDFYSIDHVLEAIKSSERILVITGAGISTSAGIPDFRSSKGFYNMVEHLGLSDPQEVFDLETFHSDPNIFYSIAHLILPPDKIYTPLHAFIKVLQNKGKLLRNYTQNIDNLESHVGLNPEKVVQCHGSFATASCVTCGYQVQGEECFPEIRSKNIPYCPKCAKNRKKLLAKEETYVPESYGVMKPDITFFGEPLPRKFHDLIREDISNCDLVISVGTSLKVAPVADIVQKVPESVPQILINRDHINHCNFDVSLLGFCDDVASFVCDKLGQSWDLKHEDYDKIRGKNGENLDSALVDEDQRLYKIINKSVEANADNTNDNGLDSLSE